MVADGRPEPVLALGPWAGHDRRERRDLQPLVPYRWDLCGPDAFEWQQAEERHGRGDAEAAKNLGRR